MDQLAREAIDRCAWVIARCGYSTELSSRRFKWRCDQIPADVIKRGNGTSPYADLAAHVLTLWRNERGYLLANGEPRPLPPRGPAPSIEALARRVGGGLTLTGAMTYLLNTGSLERRGARYLPRDPLVAHPPDSVSQQAHHMRALVDFLRTLDHNTKAQRMLDRWFQYAADNLHFPESQLSAFQAYVRKASGAFLIDKDTVLYRMAQVRRPGERTVPVSVGVYISQGPGPSRRSRRSRKKVTPSRRR